MVNFKPLREQFQAAVYCLIKKRLINLPSKNNKDKKIAMETVLIIGGGYTGLACAASLIDSGYRVFLIEKAQTLGGLGAIHTITNGTQCEAFYHHFFTHDRSLMKYCQRFLGKTPAFVNGSMGIFYQGEHHSWNGLKDLMLYPHISFIAKIRFIIATFFLSFGGIPRHVLDRYSLDHGMQMLYGQEAYKAVWRPMLRGKFGIRIQEVPLRWMQGRLRQRLKSRRFGKEYLGYLPGSLKPLTESIRKYIENSDGSMVYTGSRLEKLEYNPDLKLYSAIIVESNAVARKLTCISKIIFTIPAHIANVLIEKAIAKVDIGKYPRHEYFKAFCVIIELRSSLSNFYWTNIADESLFFCGYIEQTILTGVKEYGGTHLAYLTKYVSVGEDEYNMSIDEVKGKALYCLSKLFPKRNIQDLIIQLSVTTAENAQVVTGFGFDPPRMDMLKLHQVFLGNMSHVYPDERSINNALKIGEKLANKIVNGCEIML